MARVISRPQYATQRWYLTAPVGYCDVDIYLLLHFLEDSVIFEGMTYSASYPILHHRFSVSDYHRMRESNILTEEDRVELLAGQIVPKSPIGKFHNACVNRLNSLFHQLLGQTSIIQVQGPLALNADSQSEPDVLVLQWEDRFYADRLPGPKDVKLLIEVSDSTLDKDLKVKIPLYAEAVIPECWIVDLTREEINVFQHPVSGSYQQLMTFGLNDSIHSSVVAPISVRQILG